MADENIVALIAACAAKKPIDVRDAFASAIASKITDKIDGLRADIQDCYFGDEIDPSQVTEGQIGFVSSHDKFKEGQKVTTFDGGKHGVVIGIDPAPSTAKGRMDTYHVKF